MSQNYNFWSMSYKFKWCTKEQLEQAEQQGQITELELNQILGVTTMPANSQPESKQIEEDKNVNANSDLVLPRG